MIVCYCVKEYKTDDETDIEFNEIVKSFNESQEWLNNFNKLMKNENLEI